MLDEYEEDRVPVVKVMDEDNADWDLPVPSNVVDQADEYPEGLPESNVVVQDQGTVKYDGVRGISTSIYITIKTYTDGTFSFDRPFTVGNILCVAPSGSTVAGVSYSVANNQQCFTVIAPGDSNIYEVSEFYNDPIKTVSITAHTTSSNQSVIYDPNNNMFYITYPVDNQVIGVNGSTGAVAFSTSGSSSNSDPSYSAYENGYLFFVDQNGGGSNSASVSVAQINTGGTISFLSTNTGLGSYIDGMGYNPASGNLWIIQGCQAESCSTPSSGIYVVQTDSSATYVNKLGDPFAGTLTGGFAYDPNDNQVYVTGAQSTAGCSTNDQNLDSYNASNGAIIGNGNINDRVCLPVYEEYIPYTIPGVGHTDFVYYTGGAYLGQSNLSSISTVLPYSSPGNTPILDSIFYDGAPANYAFNLSDIYVLTTSFLCPKACLYAMPANNRAFPVVSNTSAGNAFVVGGVQTTPTTTVFIASGLPSGASWTVTYAGFAHTQSSLYTQYIVPPSGTYSYSANSVCAGTTLYADTTNGAGSASSGSIVHLSYSSIGTC